MNYEKRIRAFQDLITKENLGAFLISSKKNIAYLTSFMHSGFLFIDNKEACLFHNIFEKADVPIKSIAIKNLKKVHSFLKEQDRQISFEENSLTVAEHKAIFKGIQNKTRNGIVEKLRNVKEDEEIKLMQKSSQIADIAMQKSLPYLKEGISESDFAWILEKNGRELGADDVSFGPLVAFGENSANIHHNATNKKLEKNMPIMIDWGFVYKGYCSDITRSFFYGKPKNKWIDAYSRVFMAQKEAEKNITLGAKCSLVHNKAEKVLKEDLMHALGHEIGLDVHENIRIAKKSKNMFCENMCFTIEPGVYYRDQFGIRIENTYVLSLDGLRSFNDISVKINDMIIDC